MTHSDYDYQSLCLTVEEEDALQAAQEVVSAALTYYDAGELPMLPVSDEDFEIDAQEAKPLRGWAEDAKAAKTRLRADLVALRAIERGRVLKP
jgi:hypothetical protein